MQTIVKNDVIAIIEQLRQTSLQPGDVVNRLYGELVARTNLKTSATS